MSSLYCAPEDLKELIKKQRYHKVKLHTSKFGKADENKLFSCSSKVESVGLKIITNWAFTFEKRH